MNIEKDKVVSIHYTLKNKSEDVIDTSDGNPPLHYIQGYQNIIPGLEKALSGKTVGDKVNAIIPPEEAYGVFDEALVETVPMEHFPSAEEVKVGVQFQIDGQGGMRVATVKAVEGDNVTLDLNHPLAGETLFFDVEVMEIRDATPDELAHGHVHGPDGGEE